MVRGNQMKIKELVEELQKLPQDLDIVIATDEEGNGFHHFSGLGFCEIVEDGWSPEVNFFVYDEDGDETEEEFTAENATAICFWP